MQQIDYSLRVAKMAIMSRVVLRNLKSQHTTNKLQSEGCEDKQHAKSRAKRKKGS